MGYHRAGFAVLGVDIKPQKNYPFDFIKMDALKFLELYGQNFNVIHASPPCQVFSPTTKWPSHARKPDDKKHKDLLTPTREMLKKLKTPYVIENVVGAPLNDPLMLCGTMFDLLVVRHRIFEIYPYSIEPPRECNHQRPTVEIGRRPDRDKHYHMPVGHFSDVEFAREAMDIDWMIGKELAQAIPPAYTQYIGEHIIGQMPSMYQRKNNQNTL